MQVPQFAVRFASKALQTYWRIFKPQSHGVKAFILHPFDPARCLMIRHSYADQQRWGLPGGGYRPRREQAEDAIRRECMEELGVKLRPAIDVLDQLVTELEGKRDHLIIFRGAALSAELRPNREVAEARWTPFDLSGLPDGALVSRWARIAIAAHLEAKAAGDGRPANGESPS